MTRHKGIPASGGIAIGKSYVFRTDLPVLGDRKVDSTADELRRLDAAIQAVAARLRELERGVNENGNSERAEILALQLEFLDDPSLVGEARRSIQEQSLNAEAALMRASDALVEEFAKVEQEYFKQRADDIRDVSVRLLRTLLGLPEASLAEVPPASVVVARSLAPSDTATMNTANTVAICTEVGSAISHTAIISRSIGIPSVVGLGGLPVNDYSQLIVDGDEGVVIVDPDEETLVRYRQRKEAWETRRNGALSRATEPAYTEDGRHVEIVANVGSPTEARRAPELGAEGIGLLRTEFLFLQRNTLPDEAEQYDVYRRIFEPFPTGPIVVRTLDVGGDKELPSLKRLPEGNPFLGLRGIRLSLSEPQVFRTQLRAILRAAVGHDVRIMFPMVATVDEFRRGREQVRVAIRELEQAGTACNASCQVGMMIEVPSAAISAFQIAEEADFFSVGTNDLTQYTLAMDRTSAFLSSQADPFDPAVLFLIERTVSAAHAAGKWVGICGEMAGDPLALPFLLGIGTDELSMVGGRIAKLKEAIRGLAARELRDVVGECLRLPSGSEVRTFLARYSEERGARS